MGILVLFKFDVSNPVIKKTTSAHALSVICEAQTISAKAFCNRLGSTNSLIPRRSKRNFKEKKKKC